MEDAEDLVLQLIGEALVGGGGAGGGRGVEGLGVLLGVLLLVLLRQVHVGGAAPSHVEALVVRRGPRGLFWDQVFVCARWGRRLVGVRDVGCACLQKRGC